MDNDISQLRQFLKENMASKVDIAEIATDISDIKADQTDIKHRLDVLQTAVGTFAKSHLDEEQEQTVKSH